MRIAIVGLGKMGSFLARFLKGENEIGVYDIDRKRTGEIEGVTIIASLVEIEEFNPEILMNAVSLGSTIRVFEEIIPYLPNECILADIASVKGELPAYYKNSGYEFVSTHPMFGPTNANLNSPEGESAIIISESSERGKKFFRDFYASIGLKVFEFSFTEHDSMMAYSLTLPFSSSMVFAACVDTSAVPGTNFRKHMELARGLLSEDNALLSETLFNPRSIAQLEKITARLELLKHIIKERDYEEAAKFFNKLRQNISR